MGSSVDDDPAAEFLELTRVRAESTHHFRFAEGGEDVVEAPVCNV